MGDYLIDYQVNGKKKLFEFFLFVNPLGRKCYYSEQEIAKATEIIASRIDVNVLCIHNEIILNDFIRQLGIQEIRLSKRNEIYRKMYLSSLAFKAATLQGKRKAHFFLSKMQGFVQDHLKELSFDDVVRLAEEANLEVDMFVSDFKSDFVRELYLKDLKIANSMNVERTPSLVIFDSVNDQAGVIIEGPFTYLTILENLDELMESAYNAISETPLDRHAASLIMLPEKKQNISKI